jgi:pimeloyl-ACP methyl ester carboxylesterase
METRDAILYTLAAVGTALYGYYISEGLKTPLPGQDQDVAGGLEVESHEFATEDGALLRVKRYANPAGTPVLFCHGFQGNGFEFDLPREGYNMAVYLARKGYDIWISSFRGCGPKPYDCTCDGWHHSIDDLAIYDAPALVDGIIEKTGKKPFWIGHSMGGMVLYMYLQGVKFEGFRVVSDPRLVEERNSKLTGGIAIASPTALWWPRFHPFHVVTASSIGGAIIGANIMWVRARSHVSPHMKLGSNIRKFVGKKPRLLQLISRSPIGILLYCRGNTDRETSTSLIKWGGDDVSANMYVQLADGIRNIHFRQYYPLTFRDKPYDYTMNMDLITTPMLYITGDKDFAHWEAIKLYGYDRISSDLKSFVTFPGYGHTDLVMGKEVEKDVYPVLAEWMGEVEAAKGEASVII